MAKNPATMLRETLRMVLLHYVHEWDLNQEETIGALEITKLEVWNEWPEMKQGTFEGSIEEEDDDD